MLYEIYKPTELVDITITRSQLYYLMSCLDSNKESREDALRQREEFLKREVSNGKDAVYLERLEESLEFYMERHSACIEVSSILHEKWGQEG